MDTATINIICVIIGCVVGILGAVATSRKRSSDDGARVGALTESLGYIKAQLDSMNKKLDAQIEQNQAFAERITAVEESTKSAHKRIDSLEKNNGR